MKNNEQVNAKNKVVQKNDNVSGFTVTTLGSVISRLLGALYIIPWMAWMGNQETASAANALYQIGYAPYAFFLSLATAGVPSAISKQVSYYNGLGEYEMSKEIFKKGFILMMATGVLSAIIMFLIAPIIAAGSPGASVSDSTTVIRSLTPALMLIPIMSVTRGFIQGHGVMSPSAFSEVVEQIFRVIFMLITVYLVRVVYGGSVVLAVSLSTFAAFVGALMASGYLGVKLKQTPTALGVDLGETDKPVSKSSNRILKEIIRTAIPFIIIGSGVTLFLFIDQFTYSTIMESLGTLTSLEIQQTYGVIQGNAHKLIMIVSTLGIAMARTSIPLISNLIAKKDYSGIRKEFTLSIQLLFFLLIPAAIGMLIVAGPLYTVFYGQSDFGTEVTRISAVVSLLIASFSFLGPVLQSMNQTRPVIRFLAIGLLIKLLLQYFSLSLFGPQGMLYSHIVGYSVTVILMFNAVRKTINMDTRFVAKRILLITILSLIMGMVALLVSFGMNQITFITHERINAVVTLAAVGLSGVAVYGYLALKIRFADVLVGDKAQKARSVLRIN